MTTSQKSSGPTLNEQKKIIEKALNEFEKQMVGLPAFMPQEAPEYLTMSLQHLRKKSPEELSEAMFTLNQYALYVQRLENKQKAWTRWAKSKIDEIAAHELYNIPSGMGWSERMLIARTLHPLCKELNKVIRKTEMQLDYLDNIAYGVRQISNTLKDIKYAAIQRERTE